MFGDPGVLKATGRTMDDLARNLSQMALGRMVVDRTNLPGAFDIELMWNDTEEPPLFTALQEQLGLKLDSDRAPVDVLVIDSAKRPTEDRHAFRCRACGSRRCAERRSSEPASSVREFVQIAISL